MCKAFKFHDPDYNVLEKLTYLKGFTDDITIDFIETFYTTSNQPYLLETTKSLNTNNRNIFLLLQTDTIATSVLVLCYAVL